MSQEQTQDTEAQQEVIHYPLGKNPNSLANLNLYQPGQSGNERVAPSPKIKPYLERFLDMSLEEIEAMDPMKLPAGEAVARTLILDAMNREAFKSGWRSRQQLLDRIDGLLNVGSRGGDTYNVANMQLMRVVHVVETPPRYR